MRKYVGGVTNPMSMMISNFTTYLPVKLCGQFVPESFEDSVKTGVHLLSHPPEVRVVRKFSLGPRFIHKAFKVEKFSFCKFQFDGFHDGVPFIVVAVLQHLR